jgi:hypothetical protein
MLQLPHNAHWLDGAHLTSSAALAPMLAAAAYRLQLLLRGSADAGEGVALDELRLVVGGAQLTLRGSLLGRQQDASFALTDFPAVLLQPLFAALPALQVRQGAGMGVQLMCTQGRLWHSAMYTPGCNYAWKGASCIGWGGVCSHAPTLCSVASTFVMPCAVCCALPHTDKGL